MVTGDWQNACQQLSPAQLAHISSDDITGAEWDRMDSVEPAKNRKLLKSAAANDDDILTAVLFWPAFKKKGSFSP